MDKNQEFIDFQKNFYAFANIIATYSKAGQNILNNISQKKDKFNSMSENQRFEFMKTDPDFVAYQEISDKLEKAYVLYYNFIAGNMQESGQAAPKLQESTSESNK